MYVRVKVLGSHNYLRFRMGPCVLGLNPFFPLWIWICSHIFMFYLYVNSDFSWFWVLRQFIACLGI